MRIKTAEYFPVSFKYASYAVILVSIPLIIGGSPNLGIIFIVLAGTLLTVRYEFEIDKEKKTYREYIRLLWMKLGKPLQYEGVEYCYITASKFTQKMQLRAANSTLSGVEFNGYLKFSNGEKAHLAVGKNKEKLEATVSKVADYLGITLIDHSIEPA